VHRLDRDTSGLILLARDAESHRRLSAAFAERRVRKTYLARVHGVPAARGGWIEQPLARIATRPPRYGVVPEVRGGKSALSRWRRLDRSVQFQPCRGRDGPDGPLTWGLGCCTLVLQPLTGRSHQLRVHLAWLGHPVLGDPLYAHTCNACGPPVSRLQLHAAGLRLLHPITGLPLRLRCAGNWADL
ncbi:MAG: RluA family pseudouridine synthase, partial [Cyanobium sp.]